MIKIRWYHWVGIGVGTIATFVGVVFLVWFGFLRGEVVSYGDPLKTYFKPVAGVEGQPIQLCFEAVVWKRLCPSQLVTYLTPVRGQRLDLETYTINAPPPIDPETKEPLVLPHKLPPKCRWWTVPMLGENREAGAAVLSGHVRSECGLLDHWHPIYTQLPPTAFNWLKGR